LVPTTKAWLKSTENFFRSALSNQRAFTGEQLRHILHQHREDLGIPVSLRRPGFAEALQKSGLLKRIEVLPEQRKKKDGPASYKPFVRYVWPDITASQVALSLRPGSHFSHGTAAHLHGLMAEPAKAIYVNKEQSPKPAYGSELTQGAIDISLRNPPRASNYIYMFDGERIVLVSGKSTGNYEVVDALDKSGFPIRYTSLERTLVDIAVRPVYAGGIASVLSAYRAAGRRASVEKLVDVIKRLEHAYPYHQAVGYYLQHVGFAAHELTALKGLGLKFNFYLANDIKNAVLDPEWRIYVPAEMTAITK
jgi:hypothetical protein